jgi:hypothetical protein
MIRKQLDLPPAVARAFVDDMRAYFAEENPIKRDGIAVRQLRALREHQGPREKKLRLSDVKEMFAQMKDHTTFAGPVVAAIDSTGARGVGWQFFS